ncbi:MAG: hypothetical protein ACT4PL_10720 [Phycisphaerales bacterium]
MIDLSDGLGLDAHRIGVASGARLVIEAPLIPLHAGLSDRLAAAGDGEDYELLFTAAGTLPTHCPVTGTPITRIGSVERCDDHGCLLTGADGRVHPGAGLGFVHRAD